MLSELKANPWGDPSSLMQRLDPINKILKKVGEKVPDAVVFEILKPAREKKLHVDLRTAADAKKFDSEGFLPGILGAWTTADELGMTQAGMKSLLSRDYRGLKIEDYETNYGFAARLARSKGHAPPEHNKLR